jgi:hypothetical protein
MGGGIGGELGGGVGAGDVVCREEGGRVAGGVSGHGAHSAAAVLVLEAAEGDAELLEEAWGWRVRVGVRGDAAERDPRGGEDAGEDVGAGGEAVPRGGRVHGRHPPPQPRATARVLLRGRAPPARLRVHAQRQPRFLALRQKAARGEAPGLGPTPHHRPGHRARLSLLARRVQRSHHPLGRQAREHPPRSPVLPKGKPSLAHNSEIRVRVRSVTV